MGEGELVVYWRGGFGQKPWGMGWYGFGGSGYGRGGLQGLNGKYGEEGE
ncbi:hypothetical protein Tco_1139551, partial [Tanacetum coccineum]